MKKNYILTTRFCLFFLFFFFLSKANAQIATLDISGNYTVSGYGGMWWDYQYKPSGSSTVSQSAIIQSGNSHVIKLNPFIGWDFKRRYYNYYGQPQFWSADYPVNTGYAAISKSTSYTFNFDTPAITEGWRGYRLQNTTSNYNSNVEETSYLVNGTAGKSLFMGWVSGNGVMVVSPKISDLATDKKFSIYANGYQGNATLILGTITDPYDPTTFHPLKTATFGSGFNKIDVFLNNYNSQDQYIAFKSSGNSGSVYLDDFSYEQSVNCFDITNVSVTAITEHSAQLDFTASGTTLWEVSLKDLRSGLTEVFTTSNNPYIFTDLSGNTGYEVKVRASCGGGLFSNWTPIASFTTPCATIAAGYSTSFSEKIYLDPCWAKIESQSYVYQAPIGGNTSITPRTGSRYIEMINNNYSGYSTDKSYLVTPYITDLDNNKRIKFFLVSVSGEFDYNLNSLTIGTLSNPNDANTFVPLKTILPSEMNEINGYKTNDYWKEHIVYLDNYNNSLGHHYIAIRQNDLAGSYLHIDDFTYESIPACKEPVNLKLVKSDFESATVIWGNNNVPDNGEWEIQYGVSGFAIGSGITVQTTSNPTILTNLTAFANYDFYVRSKCGAIYSNWSDRGTFKTKCTGVTTGYAYDFENDSFDLNTCWSRTTPDIVNRSYAPNSFITYSTAQYGNIPSTHSGTQVIRLYNNQNSPATLENEKTILVTPRLSDLNNERKISFWAYVPSNSYSTLTSIQVGTLSDPEDYTTFVPHQNISSGFGINQWKNYSVDFSNYYGTNKYIGIRIVNSNTNGYVIYIDDFIYTNSDCARPSGLTATQNGADSATLSWITNNSNPVNCEIEYGIVGFTPGTGTILPAGTNPITLTNLDSNTKYQYRVRNICSSSVVNWSNQYDFKISCLVNVPFEENFDQYPATNAQYIPNFCWTINENYNENIYGGVNEYAFTNFNSSPNSAYLYNSNAEGMNAYYISPYLSDFDNTKRVKFWVNNGQNSNQVLSIGTLSNPLDLSTFVLYQDITFVNTPAYGKEVNIDFSNYSGTNKYVVFKLTGEDYNTHNFYIDDFKYLNHQNCLEPVNVQFLQIANTSALVKWDNTNGDNVQIEYGVSGFALGTGIVVDSSLNEKLITGLLPSTQYDFYLKTNCTSGQSLLVGPKKIETACNLQSLPWLEDLNNLSQYGADILPNCFKKLTGSFDLKNIPQQVYSNNSYNDDHLLNGYNDSTYLHFYNNFSSEIMTPLFALTAGTTYKLSLQARKSYEYSPMGIYASVGRGQEGHYMETNLETIGNLHADDYNELDYYFTPLESGNYSYLLDFRYSGSINVIADDFKLEEGYQNVITNYVDYNFDALPNNSLILERTTTSGINLFNLSGNSVLRLSGSSNEDFVVSNDEWQSNQNHITKVNMKINASAMSSLFMNFDLKQTFNSSRDESAFRIIVNGNVLGNVLKPITNNQDGFTSLQFDLTPYVGQDIRISLQHLGRSNVTTGDNAYLDNLRFGPTALLSTNENDFSGLKFYPNPVSDLLNIENSTLISNVEIVSVTGQSIFNGTYADNKVTVDTKNLPNGIYFLKITSEDKSKVIKIVKK